MELNTKSSKCHHDTKHNEVLLNIIKMMNLKLKKHVNTISDLNKIIKNLEKWDERHLDEINRCDELDEERMVCIMNLQKYIYKLETKLEKCNTLINVNNIKVSQLKEKNRELDELSNDILICKICYDNNINVVLECGHSYCKECINVIKKKCAFCAADITNKINLYI